MPVNLFKKLKWSKSLEVNTTEEEDLTKVPRSVVVLEVDRELQCLWTLKEFQSSLIHPNIHVIFYQEHWQTFHYVQLNHNTDIGKEIIAV